MGHESTGWHVLACDCYSLVDNRSFHFPCLGSVPFLDSSTAWNKLHVPFLMQRAFDISQLNHHQPPADWLSLLQKWRLTGQIIPRSFGHPISVVAADCCTCLTHPVAVLELCLQAWSQNSAQQPRLVCKCGRSTDYMVVNKMRNPTRVAGQLLSFAGCLLPVLPLPPLPSFVHSFCRLCARRECLWCYITRTLYASCTPFHIGALCHAKSATLRWSIQSPITKWQQHAYRIRC